MGISRKIFTVGIAGAFLAVPHLARANFVRELSGALTTDLPGITITPLGASGMEAWTIAFDGEVWANADIPQALAELASEPGMVNLLTAGTQPGTIIWTSDVPIPTGVNPFPNGSSFAFTTTAGQIIRVVFEDLGDIPPNPEPPPTPVPDSDSTLALMLIPLLGFVGVYRLPRKSLERCNLSV